MVPTRETLRRNTQPVEESQRPHQQNGAHNTPLLPAPRGGDDRSAQTRRLADPFQPRGKFDVLHQRDGRKPSQRREEAMTGPRKRAGLPTHFSRVENSTSSISAMGANPPSMR